MSVLDNLMDSIEHPLRNWKQYIILSILFVIIHFLCTTTLLEPFNIIFYYIGLIIEIIIFGYFFSVVIETMRGTDNIPTFSIIENLVDGVKYIILSLIYSIIPLAVLYLLFSTSGNPRPLLMILNLLTPNTTITGLISGEFVETFLNAIVQGQFVTTYTIIFLLGLFLSYPFIMSLTRVIATGKFKEGFKFKKIFNIYAEIGFVTYTKWFVMIYVYLIVFTGLWVLLNLVSGGDYIAYFILIPFIILFLARSMGLLYKQGIKYTDANRPQPKKVNKDKILQEEALRRKALEESAKKYSEEIERVNQLRKRNYTQTKAQLPKKQTEKPVEKQETETKVTKAQVPKKQTETETKVTKVETYKSPNTEKLENFKPVTEIKPIHVEEDNSVEKVKNMINDDSIDTNEVMNKLQKALEEKTKNKDE